MNISLGYIIMNYRLKSVTYRNIKTEKKQYKRTIFMFAYVGFNVAILRCEAFQM